MHLRGYKWGSIGCLVQWLLRVKYSADYMDLREKKCKEDKKNNKLKSFKFVYPINIITVIQSKMITRPGHTVLNTGSGK